MSHDFDDGLNYGLFNLDEIQNLPIIGEKIAAIIEKQPNIEKNILIHEMIRRLVSGLIDDILKETFDRINYFRPENVDQVRNCGSLLVGFSEKVKYELKILRSFLNRKMWRHPRFEKIRKLSQEILSTLFEKLISNSGHLNNLCLENNLIFVDISDTLSYLTYTNEKDIKEKMV